MEVEKLKKASVCPAFGLGKEGPICRIYNPNGLLINFEESYACSHSHCYIIERIIIRDKLRGADPADPHLLNWDYIFKAAIFHRKTIAQLIAEGFGSVDGFFEQNGLYLEPGSVQEKIYQQLKQGQSDYFKDIEKKVRG